MIINNDDKNNNLKFIQDFMSKPESNKIGKEEEIIIMQAYLAFKMKKIRKDKKLTQTALAELMGVLQPVVAKWEKGTETPSGTNLLKFSTVTGVRLDFVA